MSEVWQSRFPRHIGGRAGARRSLADIVPTFGVEPAELPVEESSPALEAAPDARRAEAAESEAEAGAQAILRFLKAEITLHWSIAIPFMTCFATGFILKLFFNLDPTSAPRNALLWVHRVAGLALAVLPPIAVIRYRNDFGMHLYNVRRAWTWTLDDVKWLFLMGIAAINSRIKLPDQHKFNAAEKLNFMMVMCSWPVFTATGLFLFIPGTHFITWLGHVALAFMAAPLMLGHIYMATVNKSTRVGLSGMVTGYVDRHWASHHYAHWYRENFPAKPEIVDVEEERPHQWVPELIRCQPDDAKPEDAPAASGRHDHRRFEALTTAEIELALSELTFGSAVPASAGNDETAG